MLRDQDLPRLAEVLALVAAPVNVEIDDLRFAALRVALEDYAIDQIELAGRHLLKTGYEFFPAPAEWHAAIEHVSRHAEQETLEGITAMLPPRDGDPYCGMCGDTGWAHIDRQTDRSIAHDHVAAFERAEGRVTFARACTCRATNPVWQKDRAAVALQRERRAERQRR